MGTNTGRKPKSVKTQYNMPGGRKKQAVSGDFGKKSSLHLVPSQKKTNTGSSLSSLQQRESRKGLIIWIVSGLFLVLAASAVFFVLHYYQIRTIYVDGNLHYSDDEIVEMVTGGRLGNNSLYLSMKYKSKGIVGIPFIERMDVKVLSPDTIKVVVYEKAVAGCVKYLDHYMYFDRDGIIVESADTRTAGVPQVTGIRFEHVVLHDPLPVENSDIFNDILTITQLLDKYQMKADKIFFDDTYNMTLYFEKLRVKIGKDDLLEEKINWLSSVFPEMEVKEGVLDLENFTENNKITSFRRDN